MTVRLAQRDDRHHEDRNAQTDDEDARDAFALLSPSHLPGHPAPVLFVKRVQSLKPRYPVDVPTVGAGGWRATGGGA